MPSGEKISNKRKKKNKQFHLCDLLEQCITKEKAINHELVIA
jgi:hypothetical protein